jgi:hypothetical protein
MRLGLMLRPLVELLGSLIWKPLLCALLVTTLGGCVAFKGFPERPSKLEDDLKQLQPSISADKIKQCLGIMDPPQEGSGEGSIKKVDTRATPPDEKSCRNQLAAGRMYAIDLQFSQFEEKLFRETRRSGFFATLATLGLTTTGALVSGGASQVMSGLAALTVGGREAFQKEVLAEHTLIAIHTAMRAGRARVGARNERRRTVVDFSGGPRARGGAPSIRADPRNRYISVGHRALRPQRLLRRRYHPRRPGRDH